MGFIGMVFVASFAMFRPVMAKSNAGTTLPWPFCCWGFSVMAETQGEHEEVVRKNLRGYRASAVRLIWWREQLRSGYGEDG